METIYTDDYGPVTDEQWQLYRERNVSPADHDELLDVYGRGAASRDLILAAVRDCSRDGMYDSYLMAVRAARARGNTR